MPAPRLIALVAVASVVGFGCSDDEGPPPATGDERTFCTELRRSIEEGVTVLDATAPVPSDQTAAALGRLAELAPAEVGEEVRLVADTFTAVQEVLATSPPGDPETAGRLEALDLDEGAIAEAQAAIGDYAVEACGVDLRAVNDAAVTTTVPPTTVPGTTVPPATTVPTATTVS